MKNKLLKKLRAKAYKRVKIYRKYSSRLATSYVVELRYDNITNHQTYFNLKEAREDADWHTRQFLKQELEKYKLNYINKLSLISRNFFSYPW